MIAKLRKLLADSDVMLNKWAWPSTHYAGCENDHLNCMIFKLNDALERTLDCVEAAKAMRTGKDCPMCDIGKLRNPAKDHWDTCAFAAFDAALKRLEGGE